MVRKFSGIPGSGSAIKTDILMELHAPLRIHFPRRATFIRGQNDLYQMDIIDLREYAKHNKGFNYLLVVINTFDKRAHLQPLKTKSGEEVALKLEEILKKVPAFPLLQSDDGLEFYNKHVNKVLKKHDIKLYSTRSKIKCAIAERFIRTYKGWLYKQLSINGNRKWLPIYEKILEIYNNTPNRVTGIAPAAVNASNEEKVLRKLNSRKIPPKKKKKFKVGDSVRISRERGIFEKAYFFNWSPEIFTIYKVEPTRPTVYKLKDFWGKEIEGGWYEQELKRVKYKDLYLVEKVLKKKPGYSYVKYMGFDNSENQWLKNSDVI